jgi:hypothetical protein
LTFFGELFGGSTKKYYLCTRKRKTNGLQPQRKTKNCRKGNKKIPNTQIKSNKNSKK